MIGLMIGLVGGLLEFYLLTKLTAAITSGSQKAIFLILGKVIVLAITLGAGVLFVREQLVLLGVGVAAPLLIGSTFVYIRTAMNLKKPKTKRMHE